MREKRNSWFIAWSCLMFSSCLAHSIHQHQPCCVKYSSPESFFWWLWAWSCITLERVYFEELAKKFLTGPVYKFGATSSSFSGEIKFCKWFWPSTRHWVKGKWASEKLQIRKTNDSYKCHIFDVICHHFVCISPKKRNKLHFEISFDFGNWAAQAVPLDQEVLLSFFSMDLIVKVHENAPSLLNLDMFSDKSWP